MRERARGTNGREERNNRLIKKTYGAIITFVLFIVKPSAL
jgi:hypothetical protein